VSKILANIKKFLLIIFGAIIGLFGTDILKIALKGKRCPRCNYPISKESTGCYFQNDPKTYHMCRHCGQPIEWPEK